MSAALKVRASATPAGTAARTSARHAAHAVMRTGCRGPAVAPTIRSCPVFGWPEATTLLGWGKRDRIRSARVATEPGGSGQALYDIARALPRQRPDPIDHGPPTDPQRNLRPRRHPALPLEDRADLCADAGRGPARTLLSVGDGRRDQRAHRARLQARAADRHRLVAALGDRALPADVRHARLYPHLQHHRRGDDPAPARGGD